MVFEVIFIVSMGLLVYSYLIYPAVVLVLGKLLVKRVVPNPEYTPSVTIIMSVFNEERVIADKIMALKELNYPENRISILIGSDNSTDNTNRILELFQKSEKKIRVFYFNKRQGKPATINYLAAEATSEILIITDADVIPHSESVRLLVAPFYDKSVGLVDSNISGSSLNSMGISLQEKTYLNFESRLKKAEGDVCGTMMGPSGGFYAVRKEMYTPVPESFLVDDLFISLNVSIKGFKTMVADGALANEFINDDPGSEFRRKVRISTGNFQNLAYFSGVLVRPWRRTFIPFISHKVIRWIGPLLYLLELICNGFLMRGSIFYSLLFLIQFIFILLPPLDLILKRLRINLIPLRFITHFALMNLALISGFQHFLKGVKTGIWEPTKRNFTYGQF